MDVRCERCRAQYVFDDDQVTASGLAVQCTNCGHLFRVKKKELVVTVPVKPGEFEGVPLPASAAGPKHAAGSPSLPLTPAPPSHGQPERPREWRVRQATGNTFTFRELTTLQKWIIEQKVSRDDEISLSGEQWKRLGNIAELASFFQVVEAAERNKAQQASPAVTPAPLPPLATFTPADAPPPPQQAAAPPAVPLPVHEIDLGPDEDMAAAKRGAGARAWLWVALVVVVAGAGAGAFLVPGTLHVFRAPSAAPAAQPAVVAPPAVAGVKAERPPEPPPPSEPPPTMPEPVAAPVAAPEPVVEPMLHSPPVPIVKPAVKPPDAKGPKALLAQARKLREKGQVEGALELYGRLAAMEPENVEALTGRGLCYLDLESYGPAEASFEAVLQIVPGHADALLGLAETYRFEGKKSEAIRQYERYLAAHPAGDEADVARNAIAELR